MMEAGEERIIADAIYEGLTKPGQYQDPVLPSGAPATVQGNWAVAIRYLRGIGEQQFTLQQKGNELSGTQQGELYSAALKGAIHGGQIELRSTMAVQGNFIEWTFQGNVQGNTMTGTVDLGEYGGRPGRPLEIMIRDYTGKRTFHGCIALALATVISVFAQPAVPSYDLLLRGGHVIDAANHIDAVMDVAIKDGHIAQVAPNLKPADAIKTIDVHGMYCHPRPDRHAFPCL